MDLRELKAQDQSSYNKLATHVIQSWQWGEFRQSLGLPLYRFGIFEDDKMVSAFELTLHKIPFTNYCVGYLPKGPYPNKQLSQALTIVGKKYHCAFIKIEPNVRVDSLQEKIDQRF